jgi:hypothetical protein
MPVRPRLNPGALTSRPREVVVVKLPETPVRVKRYEPRTAELLTASVSTLVPLVGFVPNDAVTPLGRPETDRFTLPVNPATFFTVTVVVPVPDGLRVRLLGEAESWKPSVTAGARVLTRLCPFGVPQPVTRS